MNKNQINWENLAKYVAGEATEDEAIDVASMFEENPELKEFTESLMADDFLMEKENIDWNPEGAWLEFTGKVRAQEKKKQLSHTPNWLMGRRTPWNRFPLGKGIQFATTLVLIVGLSFFLKPYWSEDSIKSIDSVTQQMATKNGERIKVRLTDGTVVTMNVASELTIGKKFPEKRDVYLNGEAYFEVKRDEGSPFTVHTGEADIKVLGTAFNVRAWEEEDEVEVVVTEGKVVFHSSEYLSGNAVMLTKDKKSILKTGDEPSVPVNVDSYNYLAWLRGELVFEDTDLKDVFAQLERTYDLKIELEESSYLDRHLTATFGQESIDEVLYTIALSFDLQYRKFDRKIIFSSPK